MTRIAMPKPDCVCGRPFKARGLCGTHYRAALRGSPVWSARMSGVNAPGAKFVNLCDGYLCDVVGLPSRVAPHGQGHHYCPEHYPLARCRVCGRHVRPEDTPADLWPETVSIGKQGRCHACTLGMLEEINVPQLPEPDVRTVRRMVSDWTEDPDDRMLILSSLVGDDID
jgi:hypothetical protein